MAKRYKNLNKIIAEIKPKTIVEIGAFNGAQAVNMVAEASRFHEVPELHYVGFDLFEKPPAHEGSKAGTASIEAVTYRIRRNFPKLRFNLVKGNTRESIPTWLGVYKGERRDFTADFIFLDGGHSLETIESDWVWCRRYMSKPGTVIVLDDYYFDREESGCKPLVDNVLAGDHRIKVELLDPVDRFNKPDGRVLSVQFAKVTVLS